MTRLNNDLRSEIMQKALEKSGINKETQANVERRLAWQEKVRIDSLGGVEGEKKLKKSIAKVTELLTQVIPVNLQSGNSIFRKHSYMKLNLAGANLHIHHQPRDGALVPAEHTLIAGHPLVDEFYALEAAEAATNEKRQEIESGVGAVLYQASSIKKLLQVWPEASELIPPLLPNRSAGLPMVLTTELNKLVGLPGGRKAA